MTNALTSKARPPPLAVVMHHTADLAEGPLL